MLGKKNYGEYLLHQFKNSLPGEWFLALEPLTRPRFPGFRGFFSSLRQVFRPVELFLKHQIGRSQFVAIR
jgi:hypothetical protein